MLPCIVRNFFLNNQPDALIIPSILTLLGSLRTLCNTTYITIHGSENVKYTGNIRCHRTKSSRPAPGFVYPCMGLADRVVRVPACLLIEYSLD